MPFCRKEGIFLDQSFQSLLRMQTPLKKEAENLMQLNRVTASRGLQLSPKDAEELALARRDALNRSGRIEIGSETVVKIAAAFAGSAYLTQADYAAVLEEATEAFYELKNESEDAIPDDELIRLLADGFERYGGELGRFLISRELDAKLRAARYGAAPEEDSDKDDGDGGEDEPDE